MSDSEWRNIETAPKDGTQILVWTGNECCCVEYRMLNGYPVWECGHDPDGKVAFIPTIVQHWMPLPPPPTDSREG